MEYVLNTRLNGTIAITTEFEEDEPLKRNPSLYKFIWVQSGNLEIEIDHVPMILEKDEIVPLTPVHHVKINQVNGEYLCFLFNSNFYCIFGHDSEVSCNGFLFYGSSEIKRLKLTPEQSKLLHSITDIFLGESAIKDDLQEEMLRIILKRFIISCTRIAREKFIQNWDGEKNYEIVRQFYVLVDTHYKEKKLVKDYAEMLHRSPKTLSNLFAVYELPSPLRVIHERLSAEAKRLMIYTNMSAKEISNILGFEDLATFSRFFKKMTKQTISEFREKEKKEQLPT